MSCKYYNYATPTPVIAGLTRNPIGLAERFFAAQVIRLSLWDPGSSPGWRDLWAVTQIILAWARGWQKLDYRV